MLRYRHHLEYEFDPTEIDKGIQWLTLKLKNTGKRAQLQDRVHLCTEKIAIIKAHLEISNRFSD
ncbi:MAG: hypothetical protein ABR962_05825 [Candidatus Bathyarchaeia archaeon]